MFDVFQSLALGFDTALTPTNLFYCLIGCVLGTAVGVLPGLGPAATIAMLLPFTFALEPTPSLIMLAGIYYGSQYGGSTTAILLNLPGESSSVVTTLDGYQMARQGRGGVALFTAAIGSFFAGTVATLQVALFAPALINVALRFGPSEYFSLMVLGLVASVALARGSILKALIMVVLGVLCGIVGLDINSGIPRFAFGVPELNDGLGIVAVAMGLFGFGEIIHSLNTEASRRRVGKITSLMPSRQDLRAMTPPILRGSAIGSVLGLLPGGGALLSSFMAYALEKKISRTPERFGKGAIEGVASPEAANNAAAQTSFIPMLTLGIPSNVIMALLASAMIMNGIQPGPAVMIQQPSLFWGLIASMWVGNAMLVILNLPLVGIWVRLITIPYNYLYPAIMVFCCIGVYTVGNAVFDIYVMVAFGLIGYALRRLDFEPAPLLLGMILGPMMEEYLRRALLLSHGDAFILIERPISLILLLAAVAAAVFVAIPAIRTRRDLALEE